MAESDRERSDKTKPGVAVAAQSVPDFATTRAALDAVRLGIWSWEVDGAKAAWSGNLEAVLGIAAGSFDGSYAGLERIVHGDDLPIVVDALREAVRSHGSFCVRFRISPQADSRADRQGDNYDDRHDRWLEAGGTMTTAGDGRVRMVGVCHDVTERVNLECELRSRARQQEALAQLGARALAEPDLDRLLNDAVSTVALTLGVEFVKILELLPGDTELLLRAGIGWNKELIGAVVSTASPGNYARYTLDSAVPVVTADYGTEERFTVSQILKDHRCVSGINQTISGRDGRAYGILGVRTTSARRFGAQDTAFIAAVANLLAGAIQRRQLEQRHELMIRDMRHRSGNLFSQLLALFSQTAKNSKNIAELTAKYQARVLALADAHRLITEGGWKSIPIQDLLYTVLGPYLDRTHFTGPNIDLEPDPVFSLSAALHELAANAIKHGSLSAPKGRLDLNWSVSRKQRGMSLELDWLERNGPPPRRSKRVGFGSRLIDLVIERQMNGEIKRSFSADGLSVHMIVPLTHERWPSRTASAGSPS